MFMFSGYKYFVLCVPLSSMKIFSSTEYLNSSGPCSYIISIELKYCMLSIVLEISKQQIDFLSPNNVFCNKLDISFRNGRPWTKKLYYQSINVVFTGDFVWGGVAIL